MLHILMVLVLLWSSGLQVEDNDPPEPADIRLVGGATRCAGGLQMNLHNDWKPVDDFLFGWNLRTADVVCRALDCGSALSAKIQNSYIARHVWKIKASHVQSGSALKYYEPVKPQYSSTALEITCSESVRLVNGTTLCSGRVELKAEQSWSSVCEGDFDWQDAEVVCRELGCGAPLKLQKEGYENMSALELTKEFQCRGNESTLLDCESYESTRNTCSPVRLNCSEPDNVRLVGGGSRCAGRLEMKLHDDWKPLDGLEVNLESAALVCRKLKCGLAISAAMKSSVLTQAWGIDSSRVQSGSMLREDVSTRPWHSLTYLEISCSDLLFQPMISITPSTNVVNEFSNFTISCSIKPQYPGGFFQLTFTTSNTKHSYTQQAVNHTAYFLFPAATHSHQGSYSCVYHIYVSSQKFSSESRPLHLSILASPIVFFARLAGLLLTLILCISAIYYSNKAAMSIQAGGQEPAGQQNAELEYYNLGASIVEGRPNEEAQDEGTDL